MVIGIAKVPILGDKTIFASSLTKTAEFEMKNRRAEEAKVLHLLFAVCYFCFYFSK